MTFRFIPVEVVELVRCCRGMRSFKELLLEDSVGSRHSLWAQGFGHSLAKSLGKDGSAHMAPYLLCHFLDVCNDRQVVGEYVSIISFLQAAQSF